MSAIRTVAATCLAITLPVYAATARPAAAELAPGAHYVAMGSSFAAGPGVTVSADVPPTRCTRSADNYARQLARARNLRLTDVSCGGATTAHIVGPWNELPPQIDALAADTALVTVTIGGNDIGYIGRLMAASCGPDRRDSPAVATMCQAMAARRQSADPQARATAATAPTEAAWRDVAHGLDRIAGAVRSRSPKARLIFVDYLTIAGKGDRCGQVPLSGPAADSARRIAARLARETAAAAKRAGADIVRASSLSGGHGACAKVPWMTGLYPAQEGASFVPYHPNLAGMTAIAGALDRLLAQRK